MPVWRPEESSVDFVHLFVRQAFSLIWNSLIGIRGAGQQAPGIHLNLPLEGWDYTHIPHPSSCVSTGVQSQILKLARQVMQTELSYQSLKFDFFNNYKVL